MKRHLSLTAAAAALLLVGAGCAQTAPAPAANSPAPSTNSPSAAAPGDGGSQNPTPRPGDNTDPNNMPAPSGSGVKNYNSAPYDFQYPEAYSLTNVQMTDAFRKPYLDKGLDAPLQQVTLTTETRPSGKEGEGPATIRVTQWNNAQRTPLREWAKRMGSYTGFTAAVDTSGKVDTAKFTGYPSLAYEYDGLYGGNARLIDLDGTVLQVSADFGADSKNVNAEAFAKILATLKIAPK